MLHARVTTTVLVAIATAVGSCSVAEFLGYWLHRLLHSDKIPALSRSHMIHHLRYYGPKHRMRQGRNISTPPMTECHSVTSGWNGSCPRLCFRLRCGPLYLLEEFQLLTAPCRFARCSSGPASPSTTCTTGCMLRIFGLRGSASQSVGSWLRADCTTFTTARWMLRGEWIVISGLGSPSSTACSARWQKNSDLSTAQPIAPRCIAIENSSNQTS
jgi:hypothetical protein